MGKPDLATELEMFKRELTVANNDRLDLISVNNQLHSKIEDVKTGNKRQQAILEANKQELIDKNRKILDLEYALLSKDRTIAGLRLETARWQWERAEDVRISNAERDYRIVVEKARAERKAERRRLRRNLIR